MLNIWRACVGAMLLACATLATPLMAAQGTACLPITGVINGVAYTSNINAAFAALISTNSGGAAPATDCSGGGVYGQLWFDTSIANGGLRIYDGNAWLLTGRVDTLNHVWMPVVGGGVATLASGSITDLCSLASNYVTVTGATTIASFGASCQVGQIKLVSFSTVLALAYGSTSILLPTGASITTQAGDQAVAVYQGGGVWRIVSYTRADGTALTAAIVPPIHYAGQTIGMRTTTCPTGSLPEDGSAISRTAYPALFAALGTAWGAGDGSTTFNLPNSGGQFDRGWINGQSVDSGRAFGSAQADAVGPHTHNVTGAGGSIGAAGNGCCVVGSAGQTTYAQSPSGTTETRPKNITRLNCIFVSNLP